MSEEAGHDTPHTFSGFAHREDVAAAAGGSHPGLIAQGGDVDGKITLRQIIAERNATPEMGSPKGGPGGIKPSPQMASVNRTNASYSPPKPNVRFGRQPRNMSELRRDRQPQQKPQPQPTPAQIAANPESPMAKAATRPVTVSLSRQSHLMHLTA